MEESYGSLLENYRQLPDRLEEVIAGLNESDLDLQKDGEWSIRQYICHVVEGEQHVWEHYRCVTFPGAKEERRITVCDIVEMLLRYLDGHAEDIRAIRALYGC